MLRSDHRYALQSFYLVGSLIVNDWWDVSLWVGIRGGGDFGGRDNGLCCRGYSIGLGGLGLWVSMFDVFWVFFGVVVLGGVFFGLRIMQHPDTERH